MKSIKLLLLVSLILCFLSCKKETTNLQSATQLLTRQAWIRSSGIWNPNNSGWIDFSPPPCLTDNIITYYSDLTIINDEGPTKCNSTDPQIAATGTWSLYANDTKLKFFDNGTLKTRYLDILQLDNQILKVLSRDTVTPYVTLYETTFTH
jgi:hypothetical protein